MKSITYSIAKGMLLGAVLIAIASLTGCVTTETTVTAPDGTVTRTKTSGPDAASVNAASAAVVVAGQVIATK